MEEMSKEITSDSIEPDYRHIRVGQLAKVRTDDDMLYVFRKRAWERKWFFSHRSNWSSVGQDVNEKNYPLPDSVEKWADENLGNWQYVTGMPEYDQEVEDEKVVVRGVFKYQDDS